MKYRHVHHAGNFADVHKHVLLLALLGALQAKPKGFLFLDTHGGAGGYDLRDPAARHGNESAGGIGKLLAAERTSLAPELGDYVDAVVALRRAASAWSLYPGSPLLAAERLRNVDRGVAIERETEPFIELQSALRPSARMKAIHGDGFAQIRAWLPPAERRALVLIDPPYEESREDFARVAAALHEIVGRFESCVIAAWYPIKERRDTDRWLEPTIAGLGRPTLVSELCIYAPDSRASLNGSGMLVVNPPWRIDERMRRWLPSLERLFAAGPGACSRIVAREAASPR